MIIIVLTIKNYFQKVYLVNLVEFSFNFALLKNLWTKKYRTKKIVNYNKENSTNC